MNVTYDEIRALCVGVVLGSGLTVLLILLQAMFAKPKPPRRRLELGTNHDRLDAEAARRIGGQRTPPRPLGTPPAGPIMQAGADRQAARLRDELDDDTAVDRWLQGGAR